MEDMNQTIALQQRNLIVPQVWYSFWRLVETELGALGDITKYRQAWGGWSGQDSPKEMRMEQAYWKGNQADLECRQS